MSGPAASNYCLPFKASFSLTLSHLTFLPFPSSLSAKSLPTGLYSQSCHFFLIFLHLNCFHFFSIGLQDAPLPITLALPTPMTPSRSPLCHALRTTPICRFLDHHLALHPSKPYLLCGLPDQASKVGVSELPQSQPSLSFSLCVPLLLPTLSSWTRPMTPRWLFPLLSYFPTSLPHARPSHFPPPCESGGTDSVIIVERPLCLGFCLLLHHL